MSISMKLHNKSKIQLHGIQNPQVATEDYRQLFVLMGSDLCEPIVKYFSARKSLLASLTGFNFKTPGRQAENTDRRRPGWKHPIRDLCGRAAYSRARPERPLRDRGYLQGSASRPGDTHRRPVDYVWPPPPGPGGEAWAPAPAGAPQPVGAWALALAENAQQQPCGRHVGPGAAPAQSEPPRGACAIEACLGRLCGWGFLKEPALLAPPRHDSLRMADNVEPPIGTSSPTEISQQLI